MATSRGPGRPAGTSNATKVWNVLYPREYQVQGQGHAGPETRTDFMRVGVAFPMRDKQGFSLEIHIPPPVIDGRTRLVLMPRESEDDQSRGQY